MHLCVISPGYPTSRTIDFVFVDQLCRAIAERGIRVTVIAPQSITKSIFRNVPIVRRRSIIPVSDGKFITLYRPFYITLGNHNRLKRFNTKAFSKSVLRAFTIIRQKPDVCYGHFWSAAHSIFPIAKQNNIPLFVSSGEEVITHHLDYSKSEIRDIVGYVSGVISVSTNNKNENIEAGLVSEKNSIVVPNAIDTRLFHKKNKSELRQKYGYSDSDYIIAFVGQFTERKGAKRLSEALKLLNDRSIKALFMGAGGDIPDYEEILLHGTVPHDLLADYLNCADVFVLPTLNEGCSNAIIEAMACGLPIISSDLPFNYDILNMDNSIMLDPHDINAIANSIEYLKNNPTVRQEMSKNALSDASQLTLASRAKKVIEYLEAVIL